MAKEIVPKEVPPEELFKLIFSSMFSRKMPYVLFTATPLLNCIFFTNLNVQEILTYEPKAEQYIHLVTLKNDNFVNWIYTQFPLLKESPCVIDIKKLLFVLNKTTKDYSAVKLSTNGVNVIVEFDDVREICGELVNEHVINAYKSLFYGFNKNGIWHSSGTIDDGVLKDEFTMMEVVLNEGENPIDIHAPLFRIYGAQGKDMVSVKEFGKKIKEPCSVILLTQKDNKAIRVKYVCNTSMAYIESVCPAMIWFPRQISTTTNKEKTNG